MKQSHIKNPILFYIISILAFGIIGLVLYGAMVR